MRAAPAVLASLLLVALVAEADALGVRVRWKASPDPAVTGYNVWVRELGEPYTTPRDAGMPAGGDDGALGFVVNELEGSRDYAFTVTAYREDGAESTPSNELTLVQRCHSDADCTDDDLCTTNERCRAGRCQLEHVICDAAPCTETLCEPEHGCVAAMLTDGSRCDSGDPCEPGLCTEGTCNVPQAALSRLGSHRLTVSRFGVKPLGRRHQRVSGTASFGAPSGFDPSLSGARVELRGADGVVLYSASAPATAFRSTKGGRAFRYLPKLGRVPGLERLALAFDGFTADVSLRAQVPSLLDPRSAPELGWALLVGDLCVRDTALACRAAPSRALSCL